MTTQNFIMLTNPAYHALSTVDACFNIGTPPIHCYPADMAPFIGLPDWTVLSQQTLLHSAHADRTWFIIHEKEIDFISDFKIVFTIPLFQLVYSSSDVLENSCIELTALGPDHVDEMIALTELTKPGPFMKHTIEFGNYQGIFENGKLVAMGGERMHLPGFTEISAICTHPDFTGKGYGTQLVRTLSQQILRKGLTPFLHVRHDNLRAIDVYKRLGFEIKREMFFAIFRKV